MATNLISSFLNERKSSNTEEPVKEAASNTVSDFLKEREKTSVGRIEDAKLNLSYKTALEKDPAQEAEKIKLQKQSGLAPEIIDRNFEEVKKQEQIKQFRNSDFKQKAPGAAKWMGEHPQNAALIKNDVEKVGFFESKMREYFPETTKAFRRGRLNMRLARLGEKAFLGKASSLDEKEILRINQEMQGLVAADGDVDSFGEFVERVPEFVSEQLPIQYEMTKGIVKGAGQGALTGLEIGTKYTPGKALPMAVGGAYAGARVGAIAEAARIEGSLAYLEYRDMVDENGIKLSEDHAKGAAVITGVVNGSLEFLGGASFNPVLGRLKKGLGRAGMKKLLKSPTAKKAFLRYAGEIAKSMGTEGVTEFMQEMVTSMSGKLAKMHQDGSLNKMSNDEILNELLAPEDIERAKQAGIAGAGGGGGISVVTGTPSFYQDMQNLKRSRENVRVFNELTSGVQDMEITKNSPEKAVEIVDKIIGGTAVENVFIPIEKFNEHFQSKSLSPEQVVAELGEKAAESYKEAQETGGDIVIPTSEYSVKVAGTEHHEVLVKDLKVDAFGVSENEAVELEKHLDEQIAGQLENIEARNVKDIEDGFVARAVEAGEDIASAKEGAKIASAFIKTAAKEAGVGVKTFTEQYGLDIVGPNAVMPDEAGEEFFQSDVFKKENVTFSDIEIDSGVDSAGNSYIIKAFDKDGNEIGEARFIEEDGALRPNDIDYDVAVFVEEKHRRKGIGAELYKRAEEELSMPIIHRSNQTQLGALLTKDREQSGLAFSPSKEAYSKLENFENKAIKKYKDIDNFIDKAPDESLNEYYNLLAEYNFANYMVNGYSLDRVAEEVMSKMKDEEQSLGLPKDIANEKKKLLKAISDSKRMIEYRSEMLEGTWKKAGGAYNIIKDNGERLVNQFLSDRGGDSKYRFFERKELTAKQLEKSKENLKKREKELASLNVEIKKYNDEIERQRKKFKLKEKNYYYYILKLNSDREKFVKKSSEKRFNKVKQLSYYKLTKAEKSFFEEMFENDSNRVELLEKVPSAKLDGEKLVFDKNEIQGLSDFIDESMVRRQKGEKLPPSFYQFKFLDKKLNEYNQGQTLFQDERGRIKFNNDVSKSIIQLFQGRDQSTLMHELAHWMLQVQGDMAARSDAPKAIVERHEATLKWLGVETTDEITTEHHEKFARGFEAYLREGVAPNKELKGAFERFKNWLIEVYKHVESLNVEINEEIRDVFARLLATQEEIDEAQGEVDAAPLVNDKKMLGMTDAEWKKYQELAADVKTEAELELIREHFSDLEKQRKAERKEIKARITEQVNRMPVYIALDNMQYGTIYDGLEMPEGIQQIKLDREALIKTYPKGILSKLPQPYIYAKNGGMHMDDAALIFGFESGDELVNAIIDAPKKADLINERVEAEVKRIHGDLLLDPERAKEEARKAVHNDRKAELLTEELRLLSTKSIKDAKGLIKTISKRVPPKGFYKERAINIIAKKKVRDLKPHVYLRNERKFSRIAAEKLVKGDIDGAFEAKEQQFLNYELYREARAKQEEVEKTVRYMNRLSKPAARKRIGKAGRDYLEQIDLIQETYSFKKSETLKSIDKQKSMLNFIREQQEDGNIVDIPAYIIAQAEVVSYKELPVEQLLEIRDTVKRLDSLARRWNKLLDNKRFRDMEELEAHLVSSIEANNKLKKRPINTNPTYFEEKGWTAENFLASHVKVEFLLEQLDGWEAGGPLWKALFEPLAVAEDMENKEVEKVSERLHKIFGAYTHSERMEWHTKKIYIPEIKMSLPKVGMLAVALNWGNEYNREALKDGYKWTDAQVMAVINKLETKDMKMVQEIWDYINEFWPEAAKLEKEMTGIAPDKVEASEFTTKHGTFKGGYYPLKFDNRLSDKQNRQDSKQEVQDLFGQEFAKAMTAHGHLKNRQNSGGKPVRLDLTVLSRHLTDVVHDITHRRAIVDVMKIISRPKIKNAIIDASNESLYKQIEPWLKDIATSNRVANTETLEGLLGQARAGSTVVNMGLKVTTFMVQSLGYTVSINELGAKYSAIGLAKAYSPRSPGKFVRAYQTVFEKSQFMKDRPKNFDRDIRDILKGLKIDGADEGFFLAAAEYLGYKAPVGKPAFNAVAQMLRETDPARIKLRNTYFYMIAFMDMSVAIPTWMGAYEKAMDGNVQNIAKGDEAAAIAYADRTVRVTQGSGGPKDLARIQRGTNYHKIFTMFYSYFSVLYNQFRKAGYIFMDEKNVPKLFASLMLLWFAPAVMESLLLGRGPDEDADEEEWKEWFRKKILTYPGNTMVGIRDLVNYIADDYGYSPSPAFDYFKQLGDAAKRSYEVAFDEDRELEKKDVKSIILALSYLMQLPGRQVWITSEYFYDWLVTGERAPENLKDIYDEGFLGVRKD